MAIAVAVLISTFSDSLVPTDDLYEGRPKISSIVDDKTVSAARAAAQETGICLRLCPRKLMRGWSDIVCCS